MIALFWILVAVIAWSLAGYGLVWPLLAAVFGTSRRPAEVPVAATMLVAARNEEAAIRAKIESVLAQDLGPHRLDILVVSDGSEDATLAEARATGDARVRTLETQGHAGKAGAMNLGLGTITSEIVIFSDANSLLVPGAIRALLRPFADPEIGGACGRLRPMKTRKSGWIGRMETLFWAYDNAMKSAEDRLGGAVSAQGTLYAMRRALLPDAVPADRADDFYLSTSAPAQGYRLAFVPEATAEEEVTQRTGDEFRRRVRSTERGWRALMSRAGLMNPARHGLYAVQLVSHKFLRRFTAFLLPVLFVVNAALLGQGWVYVLAFAVQLLVYCAGIGALFLPQVARLPGAGLPAFFVMGHAAMALGILRAAAGVKSARWSPVRSAAE